MYTLYSSVCVLKSTKWTRKLMDSSTWRYIEKLKNSQKLQDFYRNRLKDDVTHRNLFELKVISFSLSKMRTERLLFINNWKWNLNNIQKECESNIIPWNKTIWMLKIKWLPFKNCVLFEHHFNLSIPISNSCSWMSTNRHSIVRSTITDSKSRWNPHWPL